MTPEIVSSIVMSFLKDTPFRIGNATRKDDVFRVTITDERDLTYVKPLTILMSNTLQDIKNKCSRL